MEIQGPANPENTPGAAQIIELVPGKGIQLSLALGRIAVGKLG